MNKQSIDERPVGGTSFAIQEYPEGYDPSQQQETLLTLDQKLFSKVWKLKQEALQEIHQQKKQSSYISTIVKYLADNNLFVQDEAYICLNLFLQDTDVVRDIDVEELLKSIIEKITNKARSFLDQIILNLFEKLPDHSTMTKTVAWGLGLKIPKQIQNTLVKQFIKQILFTLIQNYGVKIFQNLTLFWDPLEKLGQSTNSDLMKIYKEATHFLGNLQQKLSNFKQKERDDYESFWKTNPQIKAPLKEDYLKNKGFGAQPAQDMYDLCEIQDILAQYPESWMEKVLSQEKWNLKKEFLDQLLLSLQACSKIQQKNTSSWISFLKRLIQDSNLAIQNLCLQIISELSSKLRKQFNQIAKQLISLVLEKLKKKINQQVQLANQCIEAFHTYVLSAEDILDAISEGFEDKNPTMRHQILCLLEILVSKQIKIGFLKNKKESLNKLLEDSILDVRSQCLKVASKIYQQYGNDVFLEVFGDLKQAHKDKIEKEMGIAIKIVSKKEIYKIKLEPGNPKISNKSNSDSQEQLNEDIINLMNKFEEKDWNQKLKVLQQIQPEKMSQQHITPLLQQLQNSSKQWRESNINLNKEFMRIIQDSIKQLITMDEQIMNIILPFIQQKFTENQFQEPLQALIQDISHKICNKFLIAYVIQKSMNQMNPKLYVQLSESLTKLILNSQIKNRPFTMPLKNLMEFIKFGLGQQELRKYGVQLISILYEEHYKFINQELQTLPEKLLKSLETDILRIKQNINNTKASENQQIFDLNQKDFPPEYQKKIKKLSETTDLNQQKQLLEDLITYISLNISLRPEGFSELALFISKALQDKKNKQNLKIILHLVQCMVRVLKKEFSLYAKQILPHVLKCLQVLIPLIKKEVIVIIEQINVIQPELLTSEIIKLIESNKEDQDFRLELLQQLQVIYMEKDQEKILQMLFKLLPQQTFQNCIKNLLQIISQHVPASLMENHIQTLKPQLQSEIMALIFNHKQKFENQKQIRLKQDFNVNNIVQQQVMQMQQEMEQNIGKKVMENLFSYQNDIMFKQLVEILKWDNQKVFDVLDILLKFCLIRILHSVQNNEVGQTLAEFVKFLMQKLLEFQNQNFKNQFVLSPLESQIILSILINLKNNYQLISFQIQIFFGQLIQISNKSVLITQLMSLKKTPDVQLLLEICTQQAQTHLNQNMMMMNMQTQPLPMQNQSNIIINDIQKKIKQENNLNIQNQFQIPIKNEFQDVLDEEQMIKVLNQLNQGNWIEKTQMVFVLQKFVETFKGIFAKEQIVLAHIMNLLKINFNECESEYQNNFLNHLTKFMLTILKFITLQVNDSKDFIKSVLSKMLVLLESKGYYYEQQTNNLNLIILGFIMIFPGQETFEALFLLIFEYKQKQCDFPLIQNDLMLQLLLKILIKINYSFQKNILKYDMPQVLTLFHSYIYRFYENSIASNNDFVVVAIKSFLENIVTCFGDKILEIYKISFKNYQETQIIQWIQHYLKGNLSLKNMQSLGIQNGIVDQSQFAQKISIPYQNFQQKMPDQNPIQDFSSYQKLEIAQQEQKKVQNQVQMQQMLDDKNLQNQQLQPQHLNKADYQEIQQQMQLQQYNMLQQQASSNQNQQQDQANLNLQRFQIDQQMNKINIMFNYQLQQEMQNNIQNQFQANDTSDFQSQNNNLSTDQQNFQNLDEISEMTNNQISIIYGDLPQINKANQPQKLIITKTQDELVLEQVQQHLDGFKSNTCTSHIEKIYALIKNKCKIFIFIIQFKVINISPLFTNFPLQILTACIQKLIELHKVNMREFPCEILNIQPLLDLEALKSKTNTQIVQENKEIQISSLQSVEDYARNKYLLQDRNQETKNNVQDSYLQNINEARNNIRQKMGQNPQI